MDKVRALGGACGGGIRALIENLIHAEFMGVVVSILDDGNVVRISDKGPE
jgi:hypothetical protein